MTTTPQPKFTWGQEVWVVKNITDHIECEACGSVIEKDCNKVTKGMISEVGKLSLNRYSQGAGPFYTYTMQDDYTAMQSQVFATQEEAQAECDRRNGK